MKIFLSKDLRRLISRELVIVLALTVTGCGKKAPVPPTAPLTETNSSPAPTASVARPAGPPVAHPSPPSQLNLPADATAQAAADQLSIELRRYVLTTRSIPKDFNDFAARHPMKFPPAPAGKEYAIEDGKVIIK